MANETALVTGATSGIGLAWARLLARKGYDLVIVARGTNALDEIRIDLERAFPIRVKAIAADLSKPRAARGVFDELEKERIEPEVLINNAGSGLFGLFAETDGEAETGMIGLNIVALTDLTKLVLKGMVERGHGRILNVASTAGFRAGPLMAVYCATKSYVLSFSEAIAEELKGTGVTVTALCPGPTTSGFARTAGMHESRSMGLRRMLSPEEVAAYGYRSMMKGRTVAIPGATNRILVPVLESLPRSMVTTITRKIRGRM
jgi:short-subunit dehydrogenase